MNRQRTVLVTGATGYVGGRLAPALTRRGHAVRMLARRPERAEVPSGAEVMRGDVLTGAGLPEAMAGVDVAYYLVHSMGRGGGSGDFAERDRRAARTFARAAREAGVERVVYLGGLPSATGGESHHLRSRHETAEILAAEGPPLSYARAAMVIGAGSASFEMLRHLVERLPVMITPRWLDTRSQPIAIGDVVDALVALGEREDTVAEAQLGGAEVLTYRDMLRRFARVVGRRPPLVVRVPVLSPRLSSYWVALVTPVEAGLVKPLVDGLRSEMVVRAAPPAGINDHPADFEAAVRAALAGR